MKTKSFIFAACAFLLCLFFHASVWSKQVVTETEKNWAHTVVAQEKSLKGDVIPNSLAVLYFQNQTGWDKLNLLQKGLTLMLITDLSKIPEFQLVERARLQALLDEMKFGDVEIFSEANRIRLGNLLRAEHIIGGSILKEKMDQFRLDSKLLQVTSDKIIASPQAEGELLAGIFQMEKTLLFEIINQVNIDLSAGQKAMLEKPLTSSLEALLLLFEGVELSDQGKYAEASEKFQKALKADPDLDLAQEFLAEISIYFAMPAAGPASSPIISGGQTENPNPIDPSDLKLKEIDNDGDGFSENQGDCNDQNPGIYLMAVEVCDGIDNNCDGQIDEGLSVDADNDGHFAPGSCAQPADDCNDADQSVFPGAIEICNNADENCNGLVDEGFDNDGDGFASCFECDDTNPAVNPAVSETCNNIDDNCDGQIDEGFDNDGDGFASCNECDDTSSAINPAALETCNNIDDNCDGQIDEGFDNDGDGFASCDECDDTNPAINPAALEACNIIDDNCDGQIDEGFDNDGDGFASCNECDDTNPAINPAARETCNNIDDNCDGQIDEGFDNDGDGFASCDECDDTNPDVNPAALEACNNIDDNCDGQIDEGFDNDGDGFLTCEGDCNDADASIFPSAPELCDNRDNNCNGSVDEGVCTDYLIGDQPPIVDPASIPFPSGPPPDDYRPGDFTLTVGTEGGLLGWGFAWSNYAPGVQTVGGNQEGMPDLLLSQETLNRTNADPYLAYAVQAEEDRLNREILAMHRQEAQGDLLDLIHTALASGDLRDRDNLLMQQADAQAGRVLMDQAGNWVRVQQYILRPDNTTIQVLNVNLRGGGSQAGLSSMNFITTLRESFDVTLDLRMLPWSQWLNTYGPQLPTGLGAQDWRYINSNNNILESMSVRFTSPSGNYLAEARTFAPYDNWEYGSGQAITSETLEYSLAGVAGTYDYTTNWQNAGAGEYWVEANPAPSGVNPGAFMYMHRTDPDTVAALVTTEFFAVGDGHIAPTEPGSGNQGVSLNNYSGSGVNDIWDALRVNEMYTESEPYIGQNNLEMVFRQGNSPDASIDLVYIPMSHMAWNPSRLWN